MINEMRIYRCMPGRLNDVLHRFRHRTIPLLEELGIHITQFWTTMIGNSNNELVYVIEWTSLGERQEKWAAFQSDPRWKAIREETERNGPIVESIRNMILEPVSFAT